MKIVISRRELADKTQSKSKIINAGDAEHLPENSRLIAEVINKILIKQEDV